MTGYIKDFNKQFIFEPEIVNSDKLISCDKFIIAGMGGSNLSAGLIGIRDPKMDIIVHRNYGLPEIAEENLKGRLIIVSSYSGNTEEAIDSFEKAVSSNLPIAVVSSGGRLIELARKNSVPYVLLPQTGIQPRFAVGYNIKAILKIMGRQDVVAELTELALILDPSSFEGTGKKLADLLKGFVPVICSSGKNKGIVYNWKIKFNESTKIPAFFNVFPELNHNEMTGFDLSGEVKNNFDKFYFIFIRDETDHPRISKRMEATKKMYEERGFKVEEVYISGRTVFHKIFSSIILADWTSYYLSVIYGGDPENVPMVEQFKDLIK